MGPKVAQDTSAASDTSYDRALTRAAMLTQEGAAIGPFSAHLEQKRTYVSESDQRD